MRHPGAIDMSTLQGSARRAAFWATCPSQPELWHLSEAKKDNRNTYGITTRRKTLVWTQSGAAVVHTSSHCLDWVPPRHVMWLGPLASKPLAHMVQDKVPRRPPCEDRYP